MAARAESGLSQVDLSMVAVPELVIGEPGMEGVLQTITLLMDIGDGLKRDSEAAATPESRDENERAHALYEGSAVAASFALDCVLPRPGIERWEDAISEARQQSPTAGQLIVDVPKSAIGESGVERAERYVHTLKNISDGRERDYKAAQTEEARAMYKRVHLVQAGRVAAACFVLNSVSPRADGDRWEKAIGQTSSQAAE